MKKKPEPPEIETRYEVVQQVEAIYAMGRRCPFPLGFLWYSQPMGNMVEIGYLFVMASFRRQGVATKLLKQLIEWYPDKVICTQTANRMSTPFVKKHGFKKRSGGWYLDPKK